MILIVDDLRENILSLKRFLELHQFRVDTAASGEEALKKILNTTYALIILDVQMPDMDGFEVAEAIAGYSKAKDTPIIFLTAVSLDKRFVTKGYASGGIDYVTKPLDPDILLLKVKTFYRLYEQKKELKDIQQQLRREIDTRIHAEKDLSELNALLEQKVQERTEELRRSNEQLEKKNSELQQFAYVSSHDLKEPLRKIQIFSDLIKQRYLKDNPDAVGYLHKIISASGRMTTLINDILEYSKLSFQPDFRELDLNLVLGDVLTDLDLLIQEKGATIRAETLPRVRSVSTQMQQLFQNILSNAIKFSKPGIPPVICIESALLAEKSFDAPVVTDEKDADYCRITIRDNGIGFNEKYLDKIFTIFQRLHPLEKYEGTGIGLAIVKKIVDNHGGLINAHGVPDKGSAFTIILPLREPPVTAETNVL
ncbi:sensor histidine kinase [Sediminibacterium soli]|uniref:sensor histidine kinase n=1 Tax=Sediminibacterium soli TaxID=2698829 RepID=UPI00137A576E|nr:response regulator [Sediminibacterium soli]NCI46644.1 response regulator [Sediminibacterium soli]